MSGTFDRLRKGEHGWTTEVALRLGGLASLGTCYRAALWAHSLIATPSLHQATRSEFAVCFAVVLSLTCGLSLTFVGSGLFRHVPIPEHSAYFPRKGSL
ncbi:hypothetical protein FHS92_002783 [Sphingobium subterraneum]|uniref:Uncharacterized protein n=1 Tax=Sphingobium subterraneum TaxID=627688 RepID=A0A841J672_9SPHN|nr:hypothetical protein [Sphingobium subterraneum]